MDSQCEHITYNELRDVRPEPGASRGIFGNDSLFLDAHRKQCVHPEWHHDAREAEPKQIVSARGAVHAVGCQSATAKIVDAKLMSEMKSIENTYYGNDHKF